MSERLPGEGEASKGRRHQEFVGNHEEPGLIGRVHLRNNEKFTYKVRWGCVLVKGGTSGLGF